MSRSWSEKIYDEGKDQLKTEQVKIPPRIEKIVLNCGVGKAVSNKQYLEKAIRNFEAVANQKPIYTKVRQSEAGFGIRKGWNIGAKATLRRNRMYEFLDRFLNIVIPRIPDFSGLNPKAFDGRGNYNMGLSDFAVFPECDIEQERLGLNITFVTTAKNDEEAYRLLSMIGFPFKK
jgi:large subunit ribosomal protein L5